MKVRVCLLILLNLPQTEELLLYTKYQNILIKIKQQNVLLISLSFTIEAVHRKSALEYINQITLTQLSQVMDFSF